MKNLIGKNIKYLREKKGMSGMGLAKAIDKTSSTISNYEKGKILPPVDILHQLCQILEVSIDTVVSVDIAREGTEQKWGSSDLQDLEEKYRLELEENKELHKEQAKLYKEKYEELQHLMELRKHLAEEQEAKQTLEEKINQLLIENEEYRRKLGITN